MSAILYQPQCVNFAAWNFFILTQAMTNEAYEVLKACEFHKKKHVNSTHWDPSYCYDKSTTKFPNVR